MNKNNYFPISTYCGSDDSELFINIVNQGIDARLTAFTKSNFYWWDRRLYLDFHLSEMEILMRRLSEIAEHDENADSWENDILFAQYGIEII